MSDRTATWRPFSRARLSLVMGFVLAACGGSTPAPIATTGATIVLPGTTSTPAGASFAASAQPSPSVPAATTLPTGTPPPPCDPGVICEGSVKAGSFATTSLGLTVGFTLTGEGWIGGGDEPHDGFRLSNVDVGGDHAIAITTWRGSWPPDPCIMTGSTKVDLTVAEFVARLDAVPGVTAADPVDRTVAGWPAEQVDLTVASQCPNAGKLNMWPSNGGNAYTLEDGRRARVIGLRVELLRAVGLVPLVKFLAVVVEADAQADFELLLQKADELIATLTIAL